MTSPPQRFLDHLAAHGWTVLRPTPTSTPAAALDDAGRQAVLDFGNSTRRST